MTTVDGLNGTIKTAIEELQTKVPDGGTGSTYLRGDGTWATPSGGPGGVSDGDKGDITVSGSGATWTIDNGAVTLAKQANVNSETVFYRKTAGAGAPEVQTLATLKTDLGLSGTNTGDQTITLGGDIVGSGTGIIGTTIQAGVIDLDRLSATGTPSASTYLRGDNTWASISSGGLEQYQVRRMTRR